MAEPFNPTGNLRGLLTGSAAGQTPAAAPVVTTGSAQAAPVLPQQPVQQETSLLDQLRQRVQQDLAPQPMTSQERLATFGRGVLSNRGSFLDNLSAGLAAQQQAEAGRREEGRKALELQAEIARRAEEIRLKQEELRDPSIRNLREAQAEYYRRRPEIAGAAAGMRGRLTDAQYANIYNQAEQEARRQFPDPTPGMPDPTSAQERRRMDREEFRNRRIEEIMLGLAQRQGGTPTPTPPPQPTQPRQQIVPVPLTGAPRPAPTER
jgi:hypothetical protein